MPVYEYQGQFYELSETDPVAAKKKIIASVGGPAPEGGFFPALRAGATELGGGISALMGRVGLKDTALAQQEYEAAKQKAAQIFQPTEEGWTESPWTKFKETLGGSLPYMAAPLAAGAAATIGLPATAAAVPVLGGLTTLGTAATLGAAGLASAGQFTATNIARQLEEEKRRTGAYDLAGTDIQSAALAAIPQAALDTLALRFMPGVGKLLGAAGIQVTKESAKQVSEQILKKALTDYAVTTGKAVGREGLIESAQQVFERLQAGLSITDPDARREYVESFIGGAVLGGALAPAGRYVERGTAARQVAGIEQEEALQQRQAARAAEEAKRKDPAYALQLDADYQAAVEKMKELQAAVPKRPGKDALPEEQMAFEQAKAARDAHLRDVLRPLTAEYAPRKAEIAQLKERQRIEGMSPEEYMLEQMGVSPSAAPATQEDYLLQQLNAPPPAAVAPPAKASALDQYAEQQIQLANEREFATALTPEEQQTVYAKYLLTDPTYLRALVQSRASLPGLSGKLSEKIRDQLKLALKGLGQEVGETREARSAEQAAAAAKLQQEREALERMRQAPEYLKGISQERVESLETDKRIKQLQEQLYTPVQAQRELFGAEPTGAPTLGETLEQARQRLAQNGMALDAAVLGQYGQIPAVAGEAPGSVTRTIAKEPDEKTVNTLLERLRSAPNVDEKIRTLAAQVQDRLPQFISALASETEEAAARTPQRGVTAPAAKEQAPVNQAGQIAEWAYKALTGTPSPELTASLQNALRDIEAVRSATELATKVGRRRFTTEEKQGLQGTTFGERAQTSLLEGEAATTLANFVQNTPKDTPVNQATGELLHALQKELPFTNRRGEPVARTTSVSFDSWEEFQKYLASEGLQALRSAQADVLGNVTLLKKTAPGEPVSRTTLEALSPANPRLQSSAGTYTFTPQKTVTVKSGAFPNIHRATMLVNRLKTAAQNLRDQVQGITDARNAFTAQAREDAQASRQIREEAEKALAKLLSTDVWETIGSGEAAETKYAGKWDTELLDKVQKAKAKLDAAQRMRDQLMAQLQSHIEAFMRRVEEYERATEPVVAYPAEGAVGPYAESVAKTQPATVMLQYEAQGEKRREAAKKAAMTARNTLSETVKDLIEVQRLVPMAQKAVNFIDDTTPLAEAAFRRKKLQEHLAEEKRLQALVSKQYTQFVSLIEQSRAGVEKPFIKTGEFEKFLVEEARLTELINQQNKSLGGFKLAVSNAKNKLNAAYAQAETSADQNQLLGLRQAVLEAANLEKGMLAALENVQKIADTPELLQQQAALKTRAYEVAERAKRGESAAKRLAEASSTKPRAEETQADREARSAEKRQEEQKFLEYVQGTTESVPREQILMEARRKILQEIQDKVDKLTPLREIAESPDSTLDERVEAANEFARLYKETTGALERRDERIRKAREREATLLKQLEETREALANPIELSARAQKQFKNDPDKLEERKAIKKAALEDKARKLLAAFNKNAKFLSDNRGVDRVKIPQTKKATTEAREKLTKLRNDPEFINRYTSEDETTRQEAREELQESVRDAYPENWREVEENISTAVERIAQTQTTERKKGPLTKKGTVAPAQLLTGTEESRKGETRTSTVNKLREPGGYADALINKVIKTRGELDAVLSRLKFIKDHPAPTKEGKEKQKAAKDRLTEEKTRLEAVMRELRAEQAPIAKELAEEKPSTAKPKKESAAEKKARELREIGEEAAEDDAMLSRGTTENPSTIDSVRTELKKAFSDLGRVQIYDSVDALIKANPQYEGKIPSDARGFVDTAGNKAFLIAENIEQGQALSVLLHEVGTHIGLKNMLGDAQYNALVNAVKSWEKKTDGSVEARVAKAARARVEAAETKPGQVNDELLAYAVEEAVNAGVKPTESKGVIGRWLSQIAALFRKGLEKFGLPPKAMDTQGLVDLAFGAAQMEMRGQVKTAPKGQGDLFFTYAGEKSGVAPDALRKAKDLQIKGAEMEKIWNATGWFQGPDKKWRYEIDDSQAKFSISDLTNKYAPGIGDKHKTTVGALMDHPELYALYPDIKNIKVTLYNDPNSDSLGSFDRTKKQIELNVGTSYDPELVLLHELQHYIQGEEGFTRGGSTTGEYLEGYTKAILNAVRESYVRQAEENAGEKYYADRVKAIDAGIEAAKAAKSKRAAELVAARTEWQKTSSAIEAELESLKNEVKSRQDAIAAARDAYFAASDAYLDLLKRRSRPDQSVIIAAKEKSDQARDALAKARAAEITYADYHKQSDALRDQKRKALKDWLNVRYAGKVSIEAAVNDAIKSQLPKSSFFGKFAQLMISEQAYQNLLGEIEARDVEERRKLTAEERAATRPYASQPQRREEILFSRNLPTAARVADQIIGKQPTMLDSVKKNMGLAFRTQVIDALAPLEKIANTAMDALKGTQMMYYLRMYGMRNNMVAEAISNGVVQLKQIERADGEKEWVLESEKGVNIKDMVKRLAQKDVVKEAGSPDAANRLFTLYMAALRGERVGYNKLSFGRAAAEAELREVERELASPSLTPEDKPRLVQRKAYLEKNIDSLPTEADFKAAKAEIESNATLKNAFDEVRGMYNEYNTNLLKLLVDTGAMSKELAERLLKDKDYIPYYRMRGGNAELVIGGETPIRVGNIKDSPHLQELVGGEEPIFNFLDSSVQNTSMLLDMALRNIAAKNVAYELADVGLASKPVKAGKSGAPKGSLEFKKDGVDHYVVVNTDHVGVPSDLLVKGMAGIPTMLPVGIRLLGIPARVLRRAVTSTPIFAAKALFRDSTAAFMTSGTNSLPVLGAINQMRKTTPLKARGITGGETFTGMPEDISRLLREMQEGRPGWSKAFAKMEALSLKADALTRNAQYESYRAQGLSEMEASLMALESMNFSKRGLSPTMHMASTLVPFLNSQIQGLDVMYKSLTGKMPFNEKLDIQRKLFTRGALMFMGTMAYAAAMQDDEEYKNAPPDVKYGNWFVRVPFLDQYAGEPVTVRVPIPFEIGYIFKALPEMLYNSMQSQAGAKDALKALNHILIQMVPGGSSMVPIQIGDVKVPAPVIIPAAMKPIIEVGLGKSFFTGRDIESAREQQEVPGMRYRPGTSEIAKYIGEATNFSPIKIEALVSGYTGGLGLAMLHALSLPLPKAATEVPEKRWSELPLVGSIFQPADASGIVNDVYERLQKVSQAADTYKGLMDRGETSKADAFLQKNKALIELESLAGDYRKDMGELAKDEREIRGAPTLTKEEKTKLLAKIRQTKIQIATEVRTLLAKTTEASERKALQAAPP